MTRYYCTWHHAIIPYGKVINVCMQRGKGNKICRNLEEAKKTKKGKRSKDEHRRRGKKH